MLEAHEKLIRLGVAEWNRWRREHPSVKPSLDGIELQGAALNGVDLSGADLAGANLSCANLNSANLEGADLRWANLEGAAIGLLANVRGALLGGAALRGARYTLNTVWPSDFVPGEHGAELVLQPFMGHLEPKPLRTDAIIVTVSPQVSATRAFAVLAALSDYYRATGGAGFEVDLEPAPSRVLERVHA